MYQPKYTFTSGGIKVGQNSSAPSDSKSVSKMYSTPYEAFFLNEQKEVLYFHVLYALMDQNLGAFEANFVTNIFNMFIYIENHWEVLCEDIATGRINENFLVSQESQELAAKIKRKANPERANFLRNEFKKGFQGI